MFTSVTDQVSAHCAAEVEDMQQKLDGLIEVAERFPGILGVRSHLIAARVQLNAVAAAYAVHQLEPA